MNTAAKADSIDDLYVYCSSEEAISYIPEGVTFLKRPEHLDLSSTSITEVIAQFTQMVEADVYVLLHATAPFITVGSIDRGINAVKSGEHDCAFTVKECYDFLWRNGKADNYDIYNIPRTQDLTPFYTETTGMYIFTKALARERHRIGETPFLITVSEIEAVDINEPIDFEIANAIYNHIILKGGAY